MLAAVPITYDGLESALQESPSPSGRVFNTQGAPRPRAFTRALAQI